MSEPTFKRFEEQLAALKPEEMREMLRSIYNNLWVEGPDTDWNPDNVEAAAETFSCMGIAPPLKTETDTPEMEERVRAAFAVSDAAQRCLDKDGKDTWATYFKHGQWWVTASDIEDSSLTFSVVDAEPGINGFDFEELG